MSLSFVIAALLSSSNPHENLVTAARGVVACFESTRQTAQLSFDETGECEGEPRETLPDTSVWLRQSPNETVQVNVWQHSAGRDMSGNYRRVMGSARFYDAPTHSFCQFVAEVYRGGEDAWIALRDPIRCFTKYRNYEDLP